MTRTIWILKILRSRTPRECVDWNLLVVWKYLLCASASHPSWVRGLKLYTWVYLSVFPLVAPFMGAWIEILSLLCVKTLTFVALPVSAWIEIKSWKMANLRYTSRTPRECVDWNLDTVEDRRLSEHSRTPRGCVDWNNLRVMSPCSNSPSHPSWVRGLK